MHNNLPFEGYSYFIESENQYRLGALVPYGTYNYRVEVLFPVLPIVQSSITIPNIYLSDFKTWVGSLNGLIEDENSQLYSLWSALVYSAKMIIDMNWIGNQVEYTRILSYYVAHYMELHIRLLKDEEEKMSLSPEEKGKKIDIEEMKINMIDITTGDFKKTTWGHLYWSMYGQHQKFSIGYIPYGGY